MDSLSKAFYEMKFDSVFSSKTGTEFQNFFAQIMSAKFPGDFVPTKTWGQEGDEKCDGYIFSTQTFYQVYAPEEMKKSKTIVKMKKDFEGALKHWKTQIKEWVFVHNSKQGTPTFVMKQLQAFKNENENIKFSIMGKAELKQIMFGINENSIKTILGPIPTYSDINELSMESIKRTLLGISNAHASDKSPVEPVSEKKLEANGLSEHSKFLLEAGMVKSAIVEDFFKQWHDPQLEDDTAAEMKKIYKAAVADGLSPDDIFSRIFNTLLESTDKTPKSMTSALTIMAYFFQTCDIFEKPRESGEV